MGTIFEFKNALGVAPAPEDFVFQLAQPNVDKPEDKTNTKRRFNGVGYTGNMIPHHSYWGNVIFDLSLMTVPDKMAILRSHNADRIVGFSDKYSITDKGLELEGYLSSATPFGQEVVALSDEGFPWQMSVRISPSRIEELTAGATAVVNGRTITGPAYIFRESKISETSFTPIGWDDGTSATALSRINTTEEDQVSKELEDKVKDLETKIADLTASNTKLTSEKEELVKQITEFAKAQKEATVARVKDAFSKAKREITDAHVEVLCAMPKEALDIMLASMVPAESQNQLPEELFAHQAQDGRQEPDGKQIEGAGLTALCSKAAEQFAKSHK